MVSRQGRSAVSRNEQERESDNYGNSYKHVTRTYKQQAFRHGLLEPCFICFVVCFSDIEGYGLYNRELSPF